MYYCVQYVSQKDDVHARGPRNSATPRVPSLAELLYCLVLSCLVLYKCPLTQRLNARAATRPWAGGGGITIGSASFQPAFFPRGAGGGWGNSMNAAWCVHR